jgi:predicted  nucleic acid-binding Zn-ribbon protein
MHPAKQLLQLQTLDLERDAKYRRLKQVIASLAEPEALRMAAGEITAAQAAVTRAHTRKQDLELEAQTLDAKIASVDERLYSGRVKNPKELSDLQNEIASLRRRRATLDDTLLEAMLALEEAERAEQQARGKLAALRATWQADQSALTDERNQLETSIAALSERRNQMMAAIAPDHLEPYQKLRRAHAGLAVARVEDGACSTCGVEISDRLLTQARLSEGLSLCGNCERILVIE